MKINLEIEESTDALKGTFSANASFFANGKPRVVLTFGKKTIIEAVTGVMHIISQMAPHATQEEMCKFYKLTQWKDIGAGK